MLVSHSKKFIFIKVPKSAGNAVESYFERYCREPSADPNNFGWGGNPVIESEFGIVGSRRGGNEDKFKAHQTAENLREILPREVWGQYLKFCVIRNPYDAIISLFWHKIHILKISDVVDSWDFPVAKALFEASLKGDVSNVLTEILSRGGMDFPAIEQCVDRFNSFGLSNVVKLDRFYTADGASLMDRYIMYDDFIGDLEKVALELGLNDPVELKTIHGGYRRFRDKQVADYYSEDSAHAVYKNNKITIDKFGFKSGIE